MKAIIITASVILGLGIIGSAVLLTRHPKTVASQPDFATTFGNAYVRNCETHDDHAYCQCTWSLLYAQYGADYLYQHSQNGTLGPEVMDAVSTCQGL